MNYIDSLLDHVTMYRLVVYYLGALLVAAGVLGAFGLLPISPVALAFSTGGFIAACSIADAVAARVFGTEPGRDSAIITALILALIVSPAIIRFNAAVVIGLISAVAIGSKYLIAWKRKQVFNPAALAVAVSALLFGTAATWWVGNLYLAPLVLVGGILIVRKIERFDLFASFAVVAVAAIVLTSPGSTLSAVWNTLAHSSFLFLGFVMLTEPSTMPPSRWLRIAYGAFAGLLFAPNIHLFSYYFTPETALLAANIFSYFVSPKGKHLLTLAKRTEMADGVYEFAFVPERRFSFRPGQYMEWTVPGAGSDSRGNRRYFTIASSPEEEYLRLGVKVYRPASTFKERLLTLRTGDSISVGQLAGDFTLPKNEKKKLVFIAGGIGITPFRSMVGHMFARGKARDAILLYGTNSEKDIAYRRFFDIARERLGMKIVYVSSKKPSSPGILEGRIDERVIREQVPDFADRIFYLSGPHSMVTSFVSVLRALDVPGSHIKTDYFPGFA